MLIQPIQSTQTPVAFGVITRRTFLSSIIPITGLFSLGTQSKRTKPSFSLAPMQRYLGDLVTQWQYGRQISHLRALTHKTGRASLSHSSGSTRIYREADGFHISFIPNGRPSNDGMMPPAIEMSLTRKTPRTVSMDGRAIKAEASKIVRALTWLLK